MVSTYAGQEKRTTTHGFFFVMLLLFNFYIKRGEIEMGISKMNFGGDFVGNISSLFGGKMPSLSFGSLGAQIAGLISAIANALSAQGTNELVNYKFRYRVPTYQIIIPGEEPIKLIPEAIQRIIITRYFDKAIHPICELFTLLPPRLHEKIIDHKNEVTVRLRLQYQAFDVDDRRVFTRDSLNTTFSLITDDENRYKDEPLRDDADKADKGSYNIADYTTEYILPLWKDSDLKAVRKVCNETFANATISTVIGKIFGQSGINNILISALDNQNSYSAITIPPMSLMNVLKYLEKNYGTYYTGTRMFLDYKRAYIMSKSGVCDAFEENEYKRTIFIVKKSNVSTHYRVGTTDDPESEVYYIFVEGDNVSTESPSSTDDAISGNNVTIVDSRGDETTVVEGAGVQRGNGNERIVSDNYGNIYNKSTLLSDITERNKRVTITTMDYNEEALTPNKEFLLVFEDPKRQNHNGFYRIVSSKTILRKKGSEFDITGQHEFVYKAPLSGEEANAIIATASPPITAKSLGIDTNVSPGKSPQEIASVESPVTGKASAPIPRTIGGNVNMENIPMTQTIPKNTNYSYDSLGNILGIKIPDYHLITDDDSARQIAAKQLQQLNALPCAGPIPRSI